MRTLNDLKKIPLHVLILATLFGVAVIIFAMIMHDVIIQDDEAFDEYVASFMMRLIHEDLTEFMRGITFLASSHFLVGAYAVLLLWYLVVRRQRNTARDIFIIAVSSFLINFSLKRLFQRVRPEGPLMEELTNYSFPSGHASLGFVFYGLLAYLVWKQRFPAPVKYLLCSLFILLGLVIGISRIYLRMHFATDVIAGFCIGFAWLIFALWMLHRWKYKPGGITEKKEKWQVERQ